MRTNHFIPLFLLTFVFVLVGCSDPTDAGNNSPPLVSNLRVVSVNVDASYRDCLPDHLSTTTDLTRVDFSVEYLDAQADIWNPAMDGEGGQFLIRVSNVPSHPNVLPFMGLYFMRELQARLHEDQSYHSIVLDGDAGSGVVHGFVCFADREALSDTLQLSVSINDHPGNQSLSSEQSITFSL